jgi:hypothetical protein
MLLALALMMGDMGTAQAEGAVDPSVFLVPRDQLTTQEKQPFMNDGEVVRPDGRYWRNWPEYEDAIERYPDAASCLVEDERAKNPVDLTRFNWDGFETFAELGVCLSRIGTTIGEIDRFVIWLRQQGYTVDEPEDYDKIYTGYEDLPGRIYYTSAHIMFSDFKKKTPIYANLWFFERWRLDTTTLHSLDILTNESGTVVGITARTNAD